MDIITILVRLLLVLLVAFLSNIPLGIWRIKTKKFSLAWFISIHLAVPLVYLLRVKSSLPSWSAVVLIIFSILGQLAGGLLVKNFFQKQKSNLEAKVDQGLNSLSKEEVA